MGLETECCCLKKVIFLLTKLHLFIKVNTNWLHSDTSGMICRHEWVFIALVTCQSQSSAHPTRIHLWKPTGEHGLSLFPFLLWSMDLYNIHTQRSHKGLRLQQYCGQSHPNNSYEVRCKSLLIIQKCLKEVLGAPLLLSNWLRIVSCQMTRFSSQEVSTG